MPSKIEYRTRVDAWILNSKGVAAMRGYLAFIGSVTGKHCVE
jgi:hypothetical protein